MEPRLLGHVAQIERVIGRSLPRHMAAAAAAAAGGAVRWARGGGVDWPGGAADEEAIERVRSAVPLAKLVHTTHGPFVELLDGLLQPDPRLRLSAESASQLPFVSRDHDLSE